MLFMISSIQLENVLFKVAGGSMTLVRSKSSFLLFLTEGSVSYQMLLPNQKKMFLAELLDFEILKIWAITVRA